MCLLISLMIYFFFFAKEIVDKIEEIKTFNYHFDDSVLKALKRFLLSLNFIVLKKMLITCEFY